MADKFLTRLYDIKLKQLVLDREKVLLQQECPHGHVIVHVYMHYGPWDYERVCQDCELVMNVDKIPENEFRVYHQEGKC